MGIITGLHVIKVEAYARMGVLVVVEQQKNKREVDGYHSSGCQDELIALNAQSFT